MGMQVFIQPVSILHCTVIFIPCTLIVSGALNEKFSYSTNMKLFFIKHLSIGRVISIIYAGDRIHFIVPIRSFIQLFAKPDYITLDLPATIYQ
jgi:hypothetical protein